MRERVSRAGATAAAVYGADKISKVRELRMLLARGVDAEQAQTKARRYRKSLTMLEQVIPGSRVVEVLRFELETLDALPPSAPNPG